MYDWIWDDEEFGFEAKTDETIHSVAPYRLFLFPEDDEFFVMDARIPTWLQAELGRGPGKGWLAWAAQLQFIDHHLQRALKARQ